jgi:hypothetical protein
MQNNAAEVIEIKPRKVGKQIKFPNLQPKNRPLEQVQKWTYNDGKTKVNFCVHISSPHWTRQDTAEALVDELEKTLAKEREYIFEHLRYVLTRNNGLDISSSCRRFF